MAFIICGVFGGALPLLRALPDGAILFLSILEPSLSCFSSYLILLQTYPCPKSRCCISKKESRYLSILATAEA